MAKGILAAHVDKFEAEMADKEACKSRDFGGNQIGVVQFHGLGPVTG